MIDQQTANMMLTAASTLDTVALHFKAAKYQMRKQYSEGVACFLSNEAMELWRHAGRIRNYVIKHDAMISDIPAQAAAPVGPAEINQCLEALKVKYKQAIGVVVEVGKKTQAAGHTMPAIFIFEICEDLQKDYQEVAKQANHTTVGIPDNLISIDRDLCRKYSTKLYKNGSE